MKLIYEAPEGEIIDFRALERIAKADDPKSNSSEGGSIGDGGTGGTSERGDGLE